MRKLFEKWFCKHKWKSHHKKERELWEQDLQGREVKTKDFTREVLICEICGKIKTIEY